MFHPLLFYIMKSLFLFFQIFFKILYVCFLYIFWEHGKILFFYGLPLLLSKILLKMYVHYLVVSISFFFFPTFMLMTHQGFFNYYYYYSSSAYIDTSIFAGTSRFEMNKIIKFKFGLFVFNPSPQQKVFMFFNLG